MNRFIKLITVITIGLLASSCDKGKQDELIKEKNKSIKVQLDAELEAFDVVDNLRAIDLTGKNSSAPQIKVKPTGKVAWAFFGFNNIEYKESDYKIEGTNGVQSLSISYTWTANSLTNLLKEGVYGAMFLTGKQGSEAAIRDFSGTTDPNGRVLEEVLDGKTIEREIPLISDITKATVKTNTSGTTEGVLLQAKLKPRGLLLGFNVKNETDEEIELHNIKIVRSPFDHAGSFSVKDVQENGSNEATVDLAFSGSEGNKFFELNTKTASLANGELSKGRYYIWGHTKANPIDSKFVVQIYYSIKGKKGIKVSNKMVLEPGMDWSTFEKREWTNGKAYRFTFTIRGGTDLYYTIVNPLAFMAEYNISADGSHLATNNLVDGSDNAMFTWEKAMKLRTGSLLFERSYYIPSKYDWASIFGDVSLNFAPGEWTKNANSQTAINRNSIYDTKVNSLEEFKKVGNVIYALRYKDQQNHTSAWSYELITKNGSSYIEIKSIGVAPYALNVDYVVSKAEHFFSHPKVVVRHLPLLGVKAPNLQYSNQWASYWSEDFYGGGSQQFFGFEANGSTYGTKPTTTLLPLRPFLRSSAG